MEREKVINCLTDIENIMVCRQEICPREELQYWIELQEGVADALALLKEQETKTGKWIPIESPTGVEAFGVKEMTVMNVRCSVCGSEEDVSFTGYKYCPRCGAKMEGR